MDNKQKQIKYVDVFKKGGLILELGSGSGDFIDLCRDRGLQVIGVDNNADKKHPSLKNKNIIKSDIKDYVNKEKKNKFDGIYARHILEHFAPGELETLFKNIYRILKPSAELVVIFPNLKNFYVATYEFWNDITHIRPYTDILIFELLNKAGFKILKNGPDKDSWDNSLFKNITRKIRAFISGVNIEPPDFYIIAEKQ